MRIVPEKDDRTGQELCELSLPSLTLEKVEGERISYCNAADGKGEFNGPSGS